MATLRVYRGVGYLAIDITSLEEYSFMECLGCLAKNSNLSPKWKHKTCVKGVAKIFNPKEVPNKSVEWLIVTITVWVDIHTAPLKSYSYSSWLVPSLLCLDRTWRGEHAKRDQRGREGWWERRKWKGERVSPGLFLLLITPRSLLDHASLVSINSRLRDDW